MEKFTACFGGDANRTCNLGSIRRRKLMWWFTGSHIGWGIFIDYLEFFYMGDLSTPLHLLILSVIYIKIESWVFIFYFGL